MHHFKDHILENANVTVLAVEGNVLFIRLKLMHFLKTLSSSLCPWMQQSHKVWTQENKTLWRKQLSYSVANVTYFNQADQNCYKMDIIPWQSERTTVNKQSWERTHVKFLHCLYSCQLPPLWNNTCPRLKKCATLLIHVRTIKSLTKRTQEKPTIYNLQFYLSNAHVTFK